MGAIAPPPQLTDSSTRMSGWIQDFFKKGCGNGELTFGQNAFCTENTIHFYLASEVPRSVYNGHTPPFQKSWIRLWNVQHLVAKLVHPRSEKKNKLSIQEPPDWHMCHRCTWPSFLLPPVNMCSKPC